MSWLAPTSEPFHAESVNKADFQYKQGERQQPIRPRDELERSQGGSTFAAESSSREAYRAYEPQAVYRHQPPAYQKPEGSMDLRTSYGNQFADAAVKPGYVRLPPIRPESQHRQQQQASDADGGGFAGGTEQAESYPNYRRAQLTEAKQASFRPARQYQRPDAPFEARSSYAGDFAAAAAATAAEKARPVRHEDQLRLSTDPMETRASASSNADYGGGGQVAARRQPIVPRGELSLAGGPFAVETTQRGDFRPQQQAGSQPPRREPIRPAGELRLASGSQPFAARTVAQDDFAARRGGERPAPVRPRGELELSREPLAVATTSRDVYTPKARDEPPPTRRRQQPQHQQQQLSTAG